MSKAVLSLLLAPVLADIVDQGAWDKVATTGTGPPPATSTVYHCMTAIENEIFVVGGEAGGAQANSYKFQTKNNEWSLLPNGQVSLIAADVIESGGAMFLFGGINGTYKNDLYAMIPSDGAAANFTLLPQDQNIAGRNGHTVGMIGSSIYVFGGWNQTRYFNDLYWLDTASYLRGQQGQWIQVNNTVNPPARNAHSMVVYAGDLYVFGGFSHNTTHRVWTQCDQVLDNCVWYGDLWRFDGFGRNWQLVNPAPFDGVVGPRPRSDHIANVIGENMIVYGGQIGGSGDTDETWAYNFRLNQWRQWTPASKPPATMRAGSAVVGNQIYMWGGHNTASDMWRYTPPVPNDRPPVESVIFNTKSIGIAVAFNLTFTIFLFFAMLHRCYKSRSGSVQE